MGVERSLVNDESCKDCTCAFLTRPLLNLKVLFSSRIVCGDVRDLGSLVGLSELPLCARCAAAPACISCTATVSRAPRANSAILSTRGAEHGHGAQHNFLLFSEDGSGRLGLGISCFRARPAFRAAGLPCFQLSCRFASVDSRFRPPLSGLHFVEANCRRLRVCPSSAAGPLEQVEPLSQLTINEGCLL